MFTGLLAASSFLLSCVFIFIFILLLYWKTYINFSFFDIALGLVIILNIIIGITIFNIYNKKFLPFTRLLSNIVINFSIPVMIVIAKLLNINKEAVIRSFIYINNNFVLQYFSPVPSRRILLLLPHCIQNSTCSRRITYSIANCVNCGKCQIGILHGLSQKYDFGLAVATGGTLARRIAKEYKPKYIIAVACERDLYSGIKDSYPVPVYGLLNQRPYGPCQDTCIQMDELFSSLSFFLQEKVVPPPPCGSLSGHMSDIPKLNI